MLREGTTTIPRLPDREPLSTQFQEFLNAVREGASRTRGSRRRATWSQVLEAAQRSLENGGAPEQLGAAAAPRLG